MTADREIERLLDAWLADGPMQVSDHVFDEAVGRVHRQRQRPAWRLLWKEPRMSAPFKAALALAAVIVVFVAGFAMLGGSGGVIGGVAGPTASPSPSPSPTPTPTPATLVNGILEAGTYIGNPLPGKPMTWTVTVPAGWIGYDGWAVFTDVPEGDPGVFVGGPTENIGIPSDSCAARGGTAPAESVGELIAAAQARDDWTVSAPVDTSLGGYSGTRIDVEAPADVTCENGNDYQVLSTFHAQGPSNRFELWVLDVEGSPLVVMRNSFPDTPAELMSQAGDILDSIVITP